MKMILVTTVEEYKSEVSSFLEKRVLKTSVALISTDIKMWLLCYIPAAGFPVKGAEQLPIYSSLLQRMIR